MTRTATISRKTMAFLSWRFTSCKRPPLTRSHDVLHKNRKETDNNLTGPPATQRSAGDTRVRRSSNSSQTRTEGDSGDPSAPPRGGLTTRWNITNPSSDSSAGPRVSSESGCVKRNRPHRTNTTVRNKRRYVVPACDCKCHQICLGARQARKGSCDAKAGQFPGRPKQQRPRKRAQGLVRQVRFECSLHGRGAMHHQLGHALVFVCVEWFIFKSCTRAWSKDRMARLFWRREDGWRNGESPVTEHGSTRRQKWCERACVRRKLRHELRKCTKRK